MSQSYITNLQSSALSNQNISSALLLATFTNTSRARKLYIRVALDQIAGNGNYVIYAKNQYAGAGSAYEQGARTTVPVPSSVTAQGFPTIALMAGATDVITVFAIGLAGDTTTPDSIVDFWEEFVGVGADGNALISTDTQDLSGSLSVNAKKINAQSVTLTGTLDLDDLVADVDATETRVVLALPNAAPQAAGGLITSTAGSLDMDDLAADVDATETRVVLALPAAAPQAAGGLVTSAAGSLDFDDLAADVDATETRVVLALPNAAPQAAGGLVTSIAGGLDLDEMNTDIEAIQTGVAAIPTTPVLTTHFDTILGTPAVSVSADIAEVNADTDELITAVAAIPTTPVLTAHFDTILGTPVVSVSADIAEIEAETDGIAALPTAVQIDTQLSGTHGAGAWGGGGSAPTVQQIDTQLSGTHGAGQWGSGSGTGFYTVVLTATISSLPADGVAIIVANDNLGVSIVAQGETDDNGNCTVFLDAGSYYVFQQRAGDTFTPNPYAITVP